VAFEGAVAAGMSGTAAFAAAVAAAVAVATRASEALRGAAGRLVPSPMRAETKRRMSSSLVETRYSDLQAG
jgi:hypothetical protein